MRLDSRRRLRVEGLETRMLLAADVATISDAHADPSDQPDSPQSIVIGDVDGNGTFDSSDLVRVFQAGKYETDQPADWGDGDWNGNDLFESGDLVLAFQSGHYDGGPAAARGAHVNANTVRLSPGSDGLADAIAAAGPRGTVIVEAGIHTESSSVMISDPVTIVGEAGAVIEFDSDAATSSPRLIEAGFHIKNTRKVQIRGLDIRDNDAGSTAILIEGSEHVTIEDNKITDFQYGVLVESADHSTFEGNEIGMSSGRLPVTSFGITLANGFGNQVRNNSVSEATFGLFASGENGKLLNNTARDNYVGIILCNVPAGSIVLPDGRSSGALIPATRWLVQGNTSTSIGAAGSVSYLVIDGANHNTLTNNQGGGSGDYDIELTALAFRFGLPEKLPASHDNIVNVGRHKDVVIKDCGDNNKVHGGDQVDTDLDVCPGG